MVWPIWQSGAAALQAASHRLDEAAAQVTHWASVASSDSAATVNISPEARGAAPASDGATVGGLASAIVDSRVAKYSFVANLRTLQTADDVTRDLLKLGQTR